MCQKDPPGLREDGDEGTALQNEIVINCLPAPSHPPEWALSIPRDRVSSGSVSQCGTRPQDQQVPGTDLLKAPCSLVTRTWGISAFAQRRSLLARDEDPRTVVVIVVGF